MTLADAEFILRLLNEPSFIQNIGDRAVRTLDDARGYLKNGPMASYERHGFGLMIVELKGSAAPIGICGLLKRDQLSDPDIGYALIPEYWENGYAYESATAVIDNAHEVLQLPRILAITNADNVGSIRVLNKMGFQFERMVRLSEDAPEIKLFALTIPRA